MARLLVLSVCLGLAAALAPDMVGPPGTDCPRTTDAGLDCIFPFIFENHTFDRCTTYDPDYPDSAEWCAVSVHANGTADQWAACMCTACAKTTPNGEPCVFPFVSDGVSYTDCTTAGSTASNDAWCSIENHEENGTLKTAGFCGKTCSTPAPTPSPTYDPAKFNNEGASSAPCYLLLVSCALGLLLRA
mmetsp:Transcript_9963/g.11312  ORF Transcript_9963/g.11312 Transcript_9963/m.11312 type:complete len:188 (+) Transcript_9963:28-591(+)|eukprot:CAMPEP_0205823100 /NCGR_PEP_ID=MMETSP0206-20130828/15030_1 /ASSEMBLY_ACC=CAM_ASM_000279 /TAXON_ID=36767 /ORGANISM="Euplotes focardii, Strain TN1" /LENGTH=187 /DNA_ID=CAMNT_0053119957 /DNA_START=29 /DNA_END=592 /DNA_ORIENTATION=+